MFVMEISLGHSTSHSLSLVQFPNPSWSISLIIDDVRWAASGLPWGSRARCETFAPTKSIAEAFRDARDFLFLGRGLNYATALEGALKLKEISYINATGYAAGEMKHGPIALIDHKMPIVCINPKSSVYDKMYSNIQEVVAREGIPISVVTSRRRA